MAERWKWKSFAQWGLFCGALYYPLFAAWTWGGGWLAKSWSSMHLGAGYVDFAGSGVVHAVGGVAALSGALVLGPRLGKYNADGSANVIPGAQHPDGPARLLRPAVRLVRVQRGLDVRRHRRAVRRGGRQHGDRRRGRCDRGDVLHDLQDRQARSGDDGQRHARRPRGHHGPVRVRRPVGGGSHRSGRSDPRDRGGAVHRAQGRRRPGRGHRCARHRRHVRRAVRRHLRQRHLRRRMERFELDGRRGPDQGQRRAVRSPSCSAP